MEEAPICRRPIRPEEKELLQYLLEMLPLGPYQYKIPAIVIEPSNAGVGTIQFMEGTYGQGLLQVSYTDDDGGFVLITVVEEKYGSLFQLEIWKADNKPLLRYPQPKDLKMIR